MSRPVFAALLVLVAASGFADEPAEKKAAPSGLRWHATVDAGLVQAQRSGQPVFVRAGGESCPWCRKLEQEIAKPEVQDELAKWTLVAFDADQSPKDARSQLVSAIPALRILTPAGRIVAKHDGYLPADQLIAFLRKHHTQATTQPGDAIAGSVAGLVDSLKDRDPIVREASVRGLMGKASEAAPRVVEVFRKGSLQARLSALDLLREWQAPVDKLDPWRPETLTEPRLAELQRWAKDPGTVRPPALTERERQELKEDLQRLVQATTAEAVAIRERLARRGTAILPDVAARLKEATTDQERERLAALRYRLAASERLALDWPGGFDRLASTQASVRQQAVQDLAARAAPGDEPVLLELFTNPDPLVREISLRALHDLAGPAATAALARLLADPEPNVRAAVLKQLAENPTAKTVAQIDAYLKVEKDPDLVVHAIRVLREVRSQESMQSLRQLIANPSWRIRAETAEALGEAIIRRSDGIPDEFKTEVTKELIRMLEDSDGFVVGRAIGALGKTGPEEAIEPAVAAAARHPETAPAVLQFLSSSGDIRTKAIPHLRKFCKHERPEVRAMAITQLCYIAESGSDKELKAALEDTSSVVRRAGAAAMFDLLDRDRDQYQPKPGGVMKSLLSAFTKPTWQRSLIGPLEPLLKSDSAEERFWAAMAIIAAGKPADAPPILTAIARTDRDLRTQAGRALPWLTWDERSKLFDQLMMFALPAENAASQLEYFGRLTQQFAAFPDSRAVAALWDLASRKGVTESHIRPLSDAILTAQFGADSVRDGRFRAVGMERDAKPVILAATERAKTGPDSQRLLALVTLHTVSPESVEAVAQGIIKDPAASDQIRADAFQIQLLCQATEAAIEAAKESLTSKTTSIRRVAITYFAQGIDGLHHLRPDDLFLSGQTEREEKELIRRTNRVVKLIVPKPPAALTAVLVQPLRHDPDPTIAAQATYLLTLFGETDAIDPLVRHWKDHAKDHYEWKRLVFRAIAVLDDDSKVPVLDEIYRTTFNRGASYGSDELHEFYWTIRIMQGPNALRLRKQMREDLGFNNGVLR